MLGYVLIVGCQCQIYIYCLCPNAPLTLVSPRSVEALLPECEPGWGLGSSWGSLVPVLSSVVTQVTQLLPGPRPSPLAPLLRPPPPSPDPGPHSR